MTRKILYMLSLLLLVGTEPGMAQVAVPNTRAGHTLQTWLCAFNGGDRSKIEAYVKTVDHSQPVDGMLAFRNRVKEKRATQPGLVICWCSMGNHRRWRHLDCGLCLQMSH
jgi:hypothetical protein